MSCDFLSLAKSGVRGLHPYQTGKPIEELQRELGLKHIIKLASNENPLGTSPKVKALLANNLDLLTRYPDGAGFDLKKALARHLDVQPNQITLGNGSNDVLDMVGLSFLDDSVSAVYSEFAFIVYPIMIQCFSAKGIKVPALNWGHDLDAMLKAIEPDTRVVFIANPNNPTGTWLRHDELHAFMRKVPARVVVVLDEAYVEYIHDGVCANGIALQREFPNIIVTRTFSKAFGLAGLRVGYSVSTPDMADILNRVREPFNVNTLAQLAAIEALADHDYLRRGIEVNDAGRKQLEAGFRDLGFSFIPSQGNFIAFDTRTSAVEVYQKLLAKGVIVRPVVPYGMPHHLRVSIGLEAENAAFLAALGQVI